MIKYQDVMIQEGVVFLRLQRSKEFAEDGQIDHLTVKP